MSNALSALEEYRSPDLRGFSHAELESDIGVLRRVIGIAEAECARRVGEIERRGSFSEDGALSITSWVDARFRTGRSEASTAVRMGRALEDMPATREALCEGEVSRAAVVQLIGARESNPEEFSRAEDLLVDTARSLGVKDLRRAVEHWREVVSPEQAVRDEEERFQRRKLHASPTFEGMVRIDGDLDPETGQVVISALSAVTGPWMRERSPDDDRTPEQMRADALGKVCRRFLDSSHRPRHGGERPHVTVVCDLEALEGRAGYSAELSDTGRITPETLRRLACDAQVSRVITSGGSLPLEVGRDRKTVPAGIRKALVVRDRHCAFPGCDRPPSWCDGHHIRHWTDGGPTDLSNLVLLCRRHHRKIHHHGFRVQMREDRPVFFRPDGTEIEMSGRAPP